MRVTWAEIDAQALRSNVAGIRRRVGPGVKILAMVKANAYGHGLVEAAREILHGGADALGVAFPDEGVALRLAGIAAPIVVFGGILEPQIDECLRFNLDLTVISVELAQAIDEAGERAGGTRVRVHIKIDTGMERVGIRFDDALPAIEKILTFRHLDVVGLCSHFATSDSQEKSFALEQLARFQSVVHFMQQKGVAVPYIHMANSGAILGLPDAYCTMVRPGLLLYGYAPSPAPGEGLEIKPVLTLKSRVIQVKRVPAGTSISYGRRYFTSEPATIVTVPAGYGDGYSRRLTNQADVLIRGKRYPVVGTICMDQCMVNAGSDDIQTGEEVVLIGRQGDEFISCWELAEKLGTIPYEILTGIAARVPRVFAH